MLSAGQPGHDAGFRQGGASQHGHWRVFGKVLGQRHSQHEQGSVNDQRDQVQLGFRSDWRHGAQRFSLHGNAYRGKAEQPEPGALVTGAVLALGPIDTSGLNLTGQWSYLLGTGGTFSVQGYLDRTRRTVPLTFGEKIDIADLQVQHSLAPRGNHALV